MVNKLLGVVNRCLVFEAVVEINGEVAECADENNQRYEENKLTEKLFCRVALPRNEEFECADKEAVLFGRGFGGFGGFGNRRSFGSGRSFGNRRSFGSGCDCNGCSGYCGVGCDNSICNGCISGIGGFGGVVFFGCNRVDIVGVCGFGGVGCVVG